MKTIAIMLILALTISCSKDKSPLEPTEVDTISKYRLVSYNINSSDKTYKFIYNSDGTIAQIEEYGNSIYGGRWEFTYDSHGNLVLKERLDLANNVVQTWTYIYEECEIENNQSELYMFE